jgi:DNA polymerase III alpha subunit
MKFSAFLIADFIRLPSSVAFQWARARFAAGNSQLPMEITDIDRRHGLLFGAFLVPSASRCPIRYRFLRAGAAVIQYVPKYGREQASKSSRWHHWGRGDGRGPRGDMGFGEVDHISKLIPAAAQYQTQAGAPDGPQLDALARRPQVGSPRVAERLEAWRAMPASARPACDFAARCAGRPALQDQQGRNCHPVRHERSEKLSLLKMDSGLTTLTIIADALKLSSAIAALS